jgi:hypothetical protein
MEEGNEVELDICLIHRTDGHKIKGMKIEVAMGQHDTLGVSRCPAGVKDLGNIIFFKGIFAGGKGRFNRGLIHHLFVKACDPIRCVFRLFEENILIHRWDPFFDGFDLRNKILIEKENFRRRFIDDVLEVTGDQPYVERKKDGPNLGNGIEGLEESMAIISQIGNPISLLDSQLQESVGKLVDPFSIVMIRKPVVAANHCVVSPVNLYGPLQKTNRRQCDIHLMLTSLFKQSACGGFAPIGVLE